MSGPRGLSPPSTMEDLQFGNFGSDDELNVFSGSSSQPAVVPSAAASTNNRKPPTPVQESSPALQFGFTDEAVDIPESDIGDADTDQLLGTDDKPNNNSSFWTFEYYQQFFDVDTGDVLRRLVGSMVPRPRLNYLQTTIRPNPDLYGPLWVAVTLIFTTGVCGNFSSFTASLIDKNMHYTFSFKKVTLAATVIFCYWWLLPTALRLVFWWRKSRSNVTFLESICIYGYSLAVYIPISILWLIPSPALQTLLVVVGMILSGSVLVLTFWPAVREDNKKIALSIMVAILLFHGLLALGFLLYFFQHPSKTTPPTTSPSPTTVPAPNNATA